MFLGQGRNRNMMDCKMTLGGPSEKTDRKRQSGYTVESGVIKPLLESFQCLMEREREFIISNDVDKVIPVVLANDGNPLKPGIKYDERLKRNVGLDIRCDAKFIKNNPLPPDPNWLKSHFITEVLVSYVTSLDDDDALPLCTDYVAKSGKTSREMKMFFTERIKILQMCSLCVKKDNAVDHIISKYQRCSSFCQQCFDDEEVCPQCLLQGQTSHLPSLRACKRCIDDGLKCTKSLVMVLTADCETGNKGAMMEIKKEIQDDTIDPELRRLSVVPDTRMSVKA